MRQPPAGGASSRRRDATGVVPAPPPDALAVPGILAAMVAPEPPLPTPPPALGRFPAIAAAALGAAGLALGARAAADDPAVALDLTAHGGALGWAIVAGGLGGAWLADGRHRQAAAAALAAAAAAAGLAALLSVAAALALLAPAFGFVLRAALRRRVAFVPSLAAALGSWFALASMDVGAPALPAVGAAALAGLWLVAAAAGRSGERVPAWRWSSLAGLAALLLLLPWLATHALAAPAVVVSTATAVCALAAGWPWFALAGAGLAAAAAATADPAAVGGARAIASAAGHVVVYDRGRHELRLLADGVWLDACGPERHEAALAAVLVQALLQRGDRVLVAGLGSGALLRQLAALDSHVVDAVDWRPQCAPLRERLAAAGPLPPGPMAGAAALPRVRRSDLPRALAALPTASRQAIALAEPIGDHSPTLTAGCQRELRAVAGDGFVLHTIALDRCPPAALQALFAAAHGAHAWNGLFAVGDAAVLVSGVAAPAWERLQPVACWPEAARWLAHRAHVGDLRDLRLALLGELSPPTPAPDRHEGVGRAAALAVVHAWVRPAPAPPAGGPSLLCRWQGLQAELRAAVQQIRRLPDDDAGRQAARAIAGRFLHVGAPRSELQAALGLGGGDEPPLRVPAAASRAAHALDPELFAAPPPVLASLPVPHQRTGDLEDLAVLPAPARLAVVAAGDNPLAIALRARFPTECARAFVQALAAGPLEPAAAEALRELADPFVLAEAARALAPRGRLRELLGLWRADLPMPDALAALAHGGGDDRQLLAASLRGRRDPSLYGALADLLQAPESAVRALAAEALQQALPGKVPYDPDWPPADRAVAAERLRSLHNRWP